jgi:hypothetical protein
MEGENMANPNVAKGYAWGFLLGTMALLAVGCAPLLIAGGAVGGYAVAKDMEDGQLIDDPPKKKENKGWFSGGND